MEHKEYNVVNKSVRKKDSMQLLLGKPVYVDDVTPGDALVVKLLRSPHANAIVEDINVSIAKKIPGIVDIYTWQDVPNSRFAIAGQHSWFVHDDKFWFVGNTTGNVESSKKTAG